MFPSSVESRSLLVCGLITLECEGTVMFQVSGSTHHETQHRI